MNEWLTNINKLSLLVVLQIFKLGTLVFVLVFHRQNSCQHVIQIDKDLIEIQNLYLSNT